MQIVGGGENIEGLYTEWENPDRDEMDAFEIGDWVAVAGDNITAGLHAMFAEHVLEHFSPTQVATVAAAAFLFLKEKAHFRIAVPDAYFRNKKYQEYTRVGSTPSGHGQNHMVAWTKDTLPQIFQAVGFTTQLIEYSDQTGIFHDNARTTRNVGEWGQVRRSAHYDSRNGAGVLRYTSLWFDAIKPEGCPFFEV